MPQNPGSANPPNLLSINIPIYKRPELLRRCLSRTIAVVEKYSIPINLLDDSLDGTNDSVLAELRNRYQFINHHKNPVNLGIDRNIDQAMRFGNSDYVWLLGEDDFLLPGALEKVLPVANQSKYPMIVVNYGFINNDLASFTRKAVIPITSDEELSSSALLARFGWAMGFIGACVLRRADLVRISADRYVGTYFSHLGCIFEAALGKECMVLSDPLVANRAEDVNSTTWAPDALNVYLGLERLLLMLDPPYARPTILAALHSAKPALPHRTVRGLMAMRAHGVLTLKSCAQIDFSGRALMQFAALAIALLPTFLFAALKRLRRFHQKLIGLRG
jgi:glycosyltransferase involved in cell wall biosynthesis